MRDRTVRRVSRLHVWVYRATRGRLGGRLANNDMLLLTTRGRRTGRRHTVPLLYLRNGERLVVIASFGGRPYHPAWYHNLVADPQVTVTADGATRPAMARVADADEHAHWWKVATAAHDGYTSYQRLTERQIPIVFLEPA